MFEEDLKIEMPPRSRLYSLQMHGSCGATQESLFDYAQRLSAKHHVSPRRMFTEVYLPEIGRAQLVGAPGILDAKVVSTVNGTGDVALDFVRGLQRLTGRSDLAAGTLLSWRELVQAKRAFSASRRWCPCCLVDQGELEHYSFSLLWSLAPVTVCPIHKIQLATVCGGCGKAQPRIHQLAPFGRCAYCRQSLASELHIVRHVADSRSLHTSAAVAEMIDFGSNATELGTAERFHAQMGNLVATQFSGSYYRLSRELRFTNSLGGGKGLIGLARLLELTYRLGTTPVAFLGGRAELQVNLAALQHTHRDRTRFSREKLAALKNEFTRLVTDLDERDELVSLSAVARRLGASDDTLCVRFPELVDALRLHNARVGPLVKAKREAARVVAIRAAMGALVEHGLPKTKSSILASLRKFGIRWETPEVIGAAKEELARLCAATAIDAPSTNQY